MIYTQDVSAEQVQEDREAVHTLTSVLADQITSAQL